MSAILMAVPNISCGNDPQVVAAVGAAYKAAGAVLLDTHFDSDHDRAVHTIAATSGRLAPALQAGAQIAVEQIDLSTNMGVHPRVGAVDVVPVVYRDQGSRGGACAEALLAGHLIGQDPGVSVFVYGELGGGRSRAQLRAGGTQGLVDRVASGQERKPDFGPAAIDPRTGATMVGARSVMVAFNLLLAEGVGIELARDVAARVREGGTSGLPGVRALGLELASQGRVQLSANLERPNEAGIAELFETVSAFAPVESGELIGLAPEVILDRIPSGLQLPGLDPVRKSIEGCLRLHGIEP